MSISIRDSGPVGSIEAADTEVLCNLSTMEIQSAKRAKLSIDVQRDSAIAAEHYMETSAEQEAEAMTMQAYGEMANGALLGATIGLSSYQGYNKSTEITESDNRLKNLSDFRDKLDESSEKRISGLAAGESGKAEEPSDDQKQQITNSQRYIRNIITKSPQRGQFTQDTDPLYPFNGKTCKMDELNKAINAEDLPTVVEKTDSLIKYEQKYTSRLQREKENMQTSFNAWNQFGSAVTSAGGSMAASGYKAAEGRSKGLETLYQAIMQAAGTMIDSCSKVKDGLNNDYLNTVQMLGLVSDGNMPRG